MTEEKLFNLKRKRANHKTERLIGYSDVISHLLKLKNIATIIYFLLVDLNIYHCRVKGKFRKNFWQDLLQRTIFYLCISTQIVVIYNRLNQMSIETEFLTSSLSVIWLTYCSCDLKQYDYLPQSRLSLFLDSCSGSCIVNELNHNRDKLQLTITRIGYNQRSINLKNYQNYFNTLVYVI